MDQHDLHEQRAIENARVFANAALAFTDDQMGFYGSHELDLICGIQHRFSTREDPLADNADSVLLRDGISATLGLLAQPVDYAEPATAGARRCVEEIARCVGMTKDDVIAILGRLVETGCDYGKLSAALLDEEA